ncbi:MAG TPA: energy-coupling factor ABC transporter permease [Anaerolineaceae bacterium]|nr:energy-coupling factor ABC transporter permease [Anaerolineaceae bacterium]HQH86541.1 energy-coupling factor ABC transporter permease [Anaerolineaceae bacterium]
MLFSATPMHIPDGFLSVLVSVVMWIASVIVIAFAIRRLNGSLSEKDIPLMGVMAAAIFAGQMLNFTVVGGTSGHLLGAALATILLGPWAAVIVMTTVVGTQALIFQDGGLLALGTNIFNMAIIGVFVSYGVDQILRRWLGEDLKGVMIRGFAAAWGSIFIASLAVALELAISGTSPANIAVPTMAGIHALIGIGEGLITLGALSFIFAARRDLLKTGNAGTKSQKGLLFGGLGIAVLLAILSPLASAYPDGLEWVAEQKGFLEAAQDPAYSIIPDYVFPGISNEAIATIVAGIVGVLVVLGIALLVARTRSRTETKA